MTVGKLEKILATIKNKRTKVVVDKESLWDGNETFTICDLQPEKSEQVWVRTGDEDGFGTFDSKGREKGKWCLVLKGGS